MHKESKPSLLENIWFSIIILVILIAAVTATWWLLPPLLMPGLTELNHRGVYGDSFGSVNALFTGLAFSGIIFTILLQQREIRLQRADFKEQLNEMLESRKEMKMQNRLLIVQIEAAIANTTAKAIELEAKAQELEGLYSNVRGNKPTIYSAAIEAKASEIRLIAGRIQDSMAGVTSEPDDGGEQ